MVNLPIFGGMEMISTMSRQFMFSSAHRMEGFGKCGKIHGHNYKCIITVKGEINDIGIVIRLETLKSIEDLVNNNFDHTLINDHPDFESIVPTAENITKWIYHRTKAVISNKEIKITLYETEKNFAECGDYV